jgi:hypothetical protein
MLQQDLNFKRCSEDTVAVSYDILPRELSRTENLCRVSPALEDI